MKTYKIITNNKVFDEHTEEENWQEKLYAEQEAKCLELGIDMNYLAKNVNIHFFDSPFFDEYTTKMNVYEAIECLAIKDGADLVQYDNENYGFVAYYNGNKNGFEIIRR